MAYQPTRESPDGDHETHRQEATDWGAADGAADRLEADDQDERADREAAPGGFSEAAASEFLRRVIHDVEQREADR